VIHLHRLERLHFTTGIRLALKKSNHHMHARMLKERLLKQVRLANRVGVQQVVANLVGDRVPEQEVGGNDVRHLGDGVAQVVDEGNLVEVLVALVAPREVA
jgi:hypothetical protein